MRVLMLNGSPADRAGLDGYLDQVSAELERAGHHVTVLRLRELALHHCIGCFGCWVRTPGECRFDDAGRVIDRQVVESDLTLLASPILLGHVSALLRRA